MCILTQCQRQTLALFVLLLMLITGPIHTEGYLPGYSEYDAPARFDNRRGQQPAQRWQPGEEGGTRQLGPMPRNFQQRPVAGTNYEQGDPVLPQSTRREYMPRSHESVSSRELHKCRIWVP